MQYDELVFKIRLRQSVLDLVGIDTLNIWLMKTIFDRYDIGLAVLILNKCILVMCALEMIGWLYFLVMCALEMIGWSGVK